MLMTADFTTFMFPTHDHVGDDYMHDPRCMGDCGPCGGIGGIEAMNCLTCGGSGKCRGCNLYNTRSRGWNLYNIRSLDA